MIKGYLDMDAARLGGPVCPSPLLYTAAIGRMAVPEAARMPSSSDGEAVVNAMQCYIFMQHSVQITFYIVSSNDLPSSGLGSAGGYIRFLPPPEMAQSLLKPSLSILAILARSSFCRSLSPFACCLRISRCLRSFSYGEIICSVIYFQQHSATYLKARYRARL